MVKGIFEIIKICVQKIKNELLLFSVITILIIVSFPSIKTYIFVIYIVTVILYTTVVIVKSLKIRKNSNRFLDNFNVFLENKDCWERREMNDKHVYFYREDNNYKIEESDKSYERWTARESWMENFPDPSIAQYKVYLKYGESRISEFDFLYCDGSRYFIPTPQKRCLRRAGVAHCLEFGYFWIRDSIEYKLGEVVGDFYRGESLEDVAHFCNIEIE